MADDVKSQLEQLNAKLSTTINPDELQDGNEDIFNSQKFIDITISYVAFKNKNSSSPSIKILTEEELEIYKKDDKLKDKVKILQTKWTLPTWGNSGDIIKKCTKFNYQTQQNEIDAMLFRDLRLKSHLVDWSAKNKNGEKIPLTDKTVNELHPGIAGELLSRFEQVVNVDREDMEKN